MRVVLAADANNPIPAFTLERADIIRQGSSDRSVSGREAFRITIAQRADGSRSEQMVNYEGTPKEFVSRNINFSNGAYIHALDSIGIKTTWKASPSRAKNLIAKRAYSRTAATACTNDSFGNPVAQVSGYKFSGSQSISALGGLQAPLLSQKAMINFNFPQR
jgi:hypothetical protein